MENARGRFSGWENGPGSHEANGSSSDAEKKKKKSKKSSNSVQRDAGSEPTQENKRRDTEKDRVSKALAEFFVVQDESGKEKAAKKEPEQESKKVRGEIRQPAVDETRSEPASVEPVERRRDERVREEVTLAHNKPEANDIDTDNSDEKTDEKPQRESERKEKDASKRWPEFELPLNDPKHEEIILPLESEETYLVPKGESEAEDAPRLEPATAYAPEVPEAADDGEPPRVSVEVPPLNYQSQPERQMPLPAFGVPTTVESAAPTEPESVPVVTQGAPEADQTVRNDVGTPEVPPMVPVTPLENRMEPAEVYRMYAERDAAQQRGGIAPNEAVVSKQVAEDDAYYAARSAQSRGFVTGLFVAGVWGHFRRKKLKREFGKVTKRQDKQIKELQVDQHYYREAQDKQHAEGDQKLNIVQRQLGNAERLLRGRESKQRHLQADPAERQSSLRARMERKLPHRGQAERGRAPRPRQDPEIAERLAVPAEHRLETSAWHTIEVDARTGQAVEQPTFAYGHEYYQERAHEAPPVSQRNAKAGEVVLSAINSQTKQAQPVGEGDNSASPLPQVNVPSASRQGPPPRSQQDGDDTRSSQPGSMLSNAPIWPFILVLVAIFICLLFLL